MMCQPQPPPPHLLTGREEVCVVLAEGEEVFGQPARGHGALTQRPEAGVEHVDLQTPLAVGAATLGQV